MSARIVDCAVVGVMATLIFATAGQARSQSPSVRVAADQETSVEDIVVEGRPLRQATADYVGRMTAPARGSGAAVWHQAVCVGVGNVQPQAAQQIIDSISDTARSLGLTPGAPGCQPRVFIVFAADADAAARDIVGSRRREFRIGVSGTDRGARALEDFETSDAPVRWWHVSLPVNPQTGQSLQRLPGSQPFAGGVVTRPSDLGPLGIQSLGSNLTSPVRDDLSQVVIIVDIDAVQGVTYSQLSDYLAMIALAQIDPDADPGSYDTILGLFRPGGGGAPGLTEWDRAFLTGLYGAEQNTRNANARLGSVADAMAQAVRVQQALPAD